jgi:peroxiredoxin Q/BCP
MPKPFELKLKEGDRAPDFEAETQDGKIVRLADFKGQKLVLYFYPRDNTPGCTKEACSFRDHMATLKKKAVLLGVSTDTVKKHARFATKYRLPFPLLADPERKMVSAYGVWGEKSFMGMKFEGTHRVTFLIGPDGRIRKIWPKVKVAGHTQEVLEAL